VSEEITKPNLMGFMQEYGAIHNKYKFQDVDLKNNEASLEMYGMKIEDESIKDLEKLAQKHGLNVWVGDATFIITEPSSLAELEEEEDE